MTFLPILGSLRKMCALDCGTINFINEKITIPRLPNGQEAVLCTQKMWVRVQLRFIYFFSICLSLFLICVDMGIYLNLPYVYSIITHVET